MLPAGGALVLASTACAQIAREPRVRLPLGEAGCRELPGFPEALAGRGRSAVLITGRTSADWPGGICRIAVGGLASHGAAAARQTPTLTGRSRSCGAGPSRLASKAGQL
jgi:hypothetical protein